MSWSQGIQHQLAMRKFMGDIIFKMQWNHCVLEMSIRRNDVSNTIRIVVYATSYPPTGGVC